MLAAAICTSGFAQKRVVVTKEMKSAVVTTEKPSPVRISDGAEVPARTFNSPENMVNNFSSSKGEGFDEYRIVDTYYDLQSNSTISNRIALWPDGTAAFVATMEVEEDSGYPNRGTGYNYYDGEGVGDIPEERVEPMRSGWPTICAYGNGELLASHASGTNVYYRPTKGEGDWELLYTFPAMTWPRMAVSGPNHEYVHIVAADQETGTNKNFLYYSRSTDGGHTWSDPIDPLGTDNEPEGIYKNNLGADDYVIATNGNNVAILFGSYTTEMFYIISHDNGETWERQNVTKYPVPGVHSILFADYPTGMEDTLFTSDNSHSIAIDNNGVVHVAFGLKAWAPSDAEHYHNWTTYNHGILYWNSEYVNEQGGHEIPLFGDWSGDADLIAEDPTLIYNGENGIANTLLLQRLDALAQADGFQHLDFFGYQVDEDGDGEWNYEHINVDGLVTYRTNGLTTLPGISIDERGNMAIIYNTPSEVRFNEENEVAYRSAWVTMRDYTGTWFYDHVNLSTDFTHQKKEVYATTSCQQGQNNKFWFTYSEDRTQGLYLDEDQTELSVNNIIAVNLDADAFEGWNVNEAINPMTAARVYPNPATTTLNVEVNASQISDVNMSVFNIMGQKVAEKNGSLNAGINTLSINTNELSSGVYFVTVKANGFDKTMKFVVK